MHQHMKICMAHCCPPKLPAADTGERAIHSRTRSCRELACAWRGNCLRQTSSTVPDCCNLRFSSLYNITQEHKNKKTQQQRVKVKTALATKSENSNVHLSISERSASPVNRTQVQRVKRTINVTDWLLNPVKTHTRYSIRTHTTAVSCQP